MRRLLTACLTLFVLMAQTPFAACPVFGYASHEHAAPPAAQHAHESPAARHAHESPAGPAPEHRQHVRTDAATAQDPSHPGADEHGGAPCAATARCHWAAMAAATAELVAFEPHSSQAVPLLALRRVPPVTLTPTPPPRSHT